MEGWQTISHGFDPQTGHVYKETSFYASAAARRKPWAMLTLGSAEEFKVGKFKNPKGAASLQDMVIRHLMVNSGCLTLNHFRHIPWPVAEKLWTRLRKRSVGVLLNGRPSLFLRIHDADLDSVSLWQLFVKAYAPLETRALEQQHGFNSFEVPHRIDATAKNNPSLSSHMLPSAVPTLLAPNFEWITVLSAFDTPLPRHEWKILAKLTNLGALFLQNDNIDVGQVDDVVLKAWGNAAAETGAFPKLELLMMRNQNNVTMGILEYLSRFPKLKAFHLTGRTFEAKEAEEAVRGSRWEWMSQSELCLKLYRMFHSSQLMTGRIIIELYNAVRRWKAVGMASTGGSDVPYIRILKVTSGNDTRRSILSVGRQQQLWWELRREGNEDLKFKRTPAGTSADALTSKKLKMRSNAQRLTADVLQEFGLGQR